MLKPARTTVPLIVSTALGLSAATMMFVLPGGAAAPTPSTFSADVSGEVWRVNRLDLDMSGDPVQVDVGVARAQGFLASAAAPDRARAVAQNLLDDPTPAGLTRVESVATATQDTAGTRTGAGAAGTIAGVVDYAASTLTARGRWGGDTTCLEASVPLTSSKSISQGSGIVPAAIPEGTPPLLPIPIPTTIPTELPSELPSDFPTDLPTDLPLPTPTDTLPTDLPTSDLTIIPTSPTLTTGLPTSELTSIVPTTGLTSGLPSIPTTDLTTILSGSPSIPTTELTTLIPTVTIPPLRQDAAAAAAAEGDVSMAEVAAASIEEQTQLQAIAGSTNKRRVYAETVGRVTDPSQPVATFFGGEAELRMTGAPTLSAYSDGGTNGSQVTWTPPVMSLTVGGTAYEVPTDGTAIALPYSKNEAVVLTISAGKLQSAESPQGVLAQAAVSALDVLIKNGDSVVLDADLFPMAVKAVAPQGGVDCTAVTPAPVSPEVKLKGRDNGAKADRLKVRAVTEAAGARATLFKVVNGKRTKLKSGALDGLGERKFKVRDKNGKKATKYLVKVRKTNLTTAGKASRKVR